MGAFKPQKFAIIGAGPVGCVVAAYLAKGGFDVTLCDVIPELLAPTLDPGIELEGVEELTQKVTRTITSVDDLADDPPEVIIVTSKATALPLIASAIHHFHREGIYVVSWQNGIDTEAVLAEQLGKQWVMRAVVNFGVGLPGPGKVHVAFHHKPHFIQELDPASADAASAIADALTLGGLDTERTDSIISMVWRKTIMNASMNPVCAVTGMTMSEAMRDPFIFETVDNLLKEGAKVARANEISLSWDYYPYCMNYLKSAGNHKPSMLMDVENKRRTEVDYINGKIVDYADQAGIKSPYNRMMRALVKAVEPG